MRAQTIPDSFEFSATMRFITSCLEEDVEQVRYLLPRVDWVAFTALIHRHRIGPILCRKVRNLDVTIPHEVVEHLEQLYKKNTVRALAHTHVIHRLSHLFAQAGIEFMLLKGFSNQHGYENLADRHVNDLDILVRRDYQIWDALKILKESGWDVQGCDPLSWNHCKKSEYLSRGKDFQLIDSNSNVCLELHFRFFSCAASKTLCVEELWADSVFLDVDGAKVVVPNEIRHFEYLVLHGCVCAWFRFKWITDVYFILCSYSEDELRTLVNRATQGGWLRPLLLTLAITERFFGLRLPDEISRFMAADRALESLQQGVLDALKDSPPSQRINQPMRVRQGGYLRRRLRYEMHLRPGVLPKWRYFSSHGFSSANWQVLPLPASMHFLYIGLHPILYIYRVLLSRR